MNTENQSSSINPTPRQETLAYLHSLCLIMPNWRVRECFRYAHSGKRLPNNHLQMILEDKPYHSERGCEYDLRVAKLLMDKNFKWEYFGARSIFIYVHD